MEPTITAVCATHAVSPEHAEARRMVDELGRLLRATGRYNLSELTTRCQAQGVPITRRTLIRWFNGHTAPMRIDIIERVALVAGVDLAYLYPDIDESVPYSLVEQADERQEHGDGSAAVPEATREPVPPPRRDSTFGVSQVDVLARSLECPPQFGEWEADLSTPRLFDPVPYVLTDKALAVVR